MKSAGCADIPREKETDFHFIDQITKGDEDAPKFVILQKSSQPSDAAANACTECGDASRGWL